MTSATYCDVYALVEATPISGPALMWIPEWVSRERVDYRRQLDSSDPCLDERCNARELLACETDTEERTHADSVDDTQTQGTTLQAVSHGEDGVGGLTRLRDKDGNVVAEDGCSAVKEVGR